MKKLFLFALLLPFLYSCNNKKQVFLEDATLKVVNFEKRAEISGHKLSLDLIGISNLYIFDSIILFTTPQADKMYSAITLANNNPVSFVNKGRGPDELNSALSPLYAQADNNTISVAVFDNTVSKIKFINLTESITGNTAIFDKEEIDLKNLFGLYKAFPLSEGKFFVDYFNNKTFSQNYSIYDTASSAFTVDKTAIDMDLKGFDNSYLMATVTAFNKNLKRYVSAMNFVDQVNFYNLTDPGTSFSVTVSPQRKSVSSIKDEPMPEKMEYYYDLRSTGSHLFGLYVNQNRKDWSMEDTPATIHVFDWDGNPIIELTTKEKIIRLDVDQKNNKIYGLTLDDAIYVYDLPHF